MTEVLLKELTNSDIDWMLAAGQQSEIAAGTLLIQPGRPVEVLHVLLDGLLRVSIPQADDHPLGRAFAALEGGQVGREIARLHRGEIVGEIPWIEQYRPTTTVEALESSLILSIPCDRLLQKLKQDVNFAAHLYRAHAILLSSRLESLMEQIGHSMVALSRSQLREVLFIFAELRDSDIDWMITAGKVSRFAKDDILIHAGRPIEALHLLLEGRVAMTLAEDTNNPLRQAFTHLETNRLPEQELTRLSRGDLLGETPFIEARPPAVTVRAIEDSLVLSIPRWRLSAKLLHDASFAARFYRVLTVLLTDKQQAIVQRLGYGRLTYSTGESLEAQTHYDNELSANFLSQMSIAGARFEWLLRQVQATSDR